MPQRHRQNFIGGLIEDNPLASGATTITSAALAAVDEVVLGTTYIPIVLDPDGIGGAPEIAYITAHATAATTATISRAEESTAAREHKQDIRWVHGPTSADFASDWALIEEIEPGAVQQLEFTNIPNYFRDLVIEGEIRSSVAAIADELRVRVGAGTVDTGGSYRYARSWIDEVDASAMSNGEGADFISAAAVAAQTSDAGVFGTFSMTIRRYADSTRFRHFDMIWSVLGDNANEMRNGQSSGAWSNAADPVDVVRVYLQGGNYEAGSYLSLYGRGERRNP